MHPNGPFERGYDRVNAGRMLSYAMAQQETVQRRENLAEEMLAYILHLPGTGSAMLHGLTQGEDDNFSSFLQQVAYSTGRPDITLHSASSNSYIVELKVGASFTTNQLQPSYWTGTRNFVVVRSDDLQAALEVMGGSGKLAVQWPHTHDNAEEPYNSDPKQPIIEFITWNGLRNLVLGKYEGSVKHCRRQQELWGVLVDFAETAMLRTAPISGRAQEALKFTDLNRRALNAYQDLAGKVQVGAVAFTATKKDKETYLAVALSSKLSEDKPDAASTQHWNLEFDPTTLRRSSEGTEVCWPLYFSRWTQSDVGGRTSYQWIPVPLPTLEGGLHCLDLSTFKEQVLKDAAQWSGKLDGLPKEGVRHSYDVTNEKVAAAEETRRKLLAQLVQNAGRPVDGTNDPLEPLSANKDACREGEDQDEALLEALQVIQHNQDRLQQAITPLHELMLRAREREEKDMRMAGWCQAALTAAQSADVDAFDAALRHVRAGLAAWQALAMRLPGDKIELRGGAEACEGYSLSGTLLWQLLWDLRRTFEQGELAKEPAVFPGVWQFAEHSLALGGDGPYGLVLTWSGEKYQLAESTLEELDADLLLAGAVREVREALRSSMAPVPGGVWVEIASRDLA